MSGHEHRLPSMPMSQAEASMQAGPVVGLVHLSDMWKLTEWSDGDLVLARASLKHVLALIEREAGSRGLISPTRGVR